MKALKSASLGGKSLFGGGLGRVFGGFLGVGVILRVFTGLNGMSLGFRIRIAFLLNLLLIFTFLGIFYLLILIRLSI